MTERLGKNMELYRYSFFPDLFLPIKEKKEKSAKRVKKGLKRKKKTFYRYSQSNEPTALNNVARKDLPIDKAGWQYNASAQLGPPRPTRSMEVTELDKTFQVHCAGIKRGLRGEADRKRIAKMEKQLYELHPRKRARRNPGLESNFDCQCITLVVVLIIIFLIAIFLTFRITDVLVMEQEGTSPPTHKRSMPELPYGIAETNETKEDDKNATRRVVFTDQYACVYHVAAEGLRVDGIEYDLSLFPISYCQLVLYCCAALNSRLEPVPQPGQPDRFDQFLRLAMSQPKLTAKLIISLDDDRQFLELLERPALLETLGRALSVWCLWHGYSGVFVRSQTAVHGLERLAVQLGRALQIVGLTTGVVFPDGDNRWSALGLNRLARTLGEFSILVEPSSYPPQYYKGLTFSHYTAATINRLRRLADAMHDDPSRRSVCYMLPVDTLVFRVSSGSKIIRGQVPDQMLSLGPGPAGPITRQPGRRAFFETCNVSSGARKALSFADVSVANGSWMSSASPETLPRFVAQLLRETGVGCAGLWNPHWDDFSGTCGRDSFPLTKATSNLFRRESATSVPPPEVDSDLHL